MGPLCASVPDQTRGGNDNTPISSLQNSEDKRKIEELTLQLKNKDYQIASLTNKEELQITQIKEKDEEIATMQKQLETLKNELGIIDADC